MRMRMHMYMPARLPAFCKDGTTLSDPSSEIHPEASRKLVVAMRSKADGSLFLHVAEPVA